MAQNLSGRIKGESTVSEKIPEGWKMVKLGEIAEINMGQSPKSEFYNEDGIGLPFLQGNRTFGIKYPYFGTYCSRPKKIAKKGEILFSVRAPVGDINIANREICIGRGLAALNSKNGNNEFLYFLLHFLKRKIINNETGSVFGAVSKNVLSSVEFLLPPLPEQRAIASVLSSLDDKIDLLHRQNRTLEGMAEALFRQWFIEEKEEGWGERKLGDIADINPHYELKKGQIATYLDMKNVNTSSFNPSGWKKRKFTSGMKFKNGDTLLARITPSLENGKTCFVTFLENDEVGWGSTEYIVIRMKKPFHPFTSYVLAKTKEFRDFAISSMSGSSGRQRARAEVVNEYELKIPPYEIIQNMNCQLKGILSKLRNNAEQIRTLEKMRDTLLPKLMNGEVRVRYETEEKEQPAEDFISQHIEESIEPWPINSKFREAVLFSGVVAAMSDEKFTPDRVRVTKAEYLAKRYMGMDVLGEYSKMAAGPYDPAIRYKGPEKIAKKNGYVEAVGRTQFRKGPKFEDAEKYLEKYGYKQALEWLERFKYTKNKELELLATVDYAVLDLMRQGKTVSVESVIEYIRADDEWKKKLKEKADVFNPEKVKWALKELASMFPETYNKNLEGVEFNG